MELSTEKKVGLFFLMALIGLGVMIEMVQDWHPFQKQVPYRAYFESSVGLRVGDPVRLAGVEVGKVRSIEIEGGRVRVTLHVADGTAVRSDSIAEIRQTNLLGGQFLGLTFGSPEAELAPPNASLPTRQGANIDELITGLQKNQEKVLGALGDLLEETREPLKDSITRLDAIFKKIDAGEGTLGRLVSDPALYDNTRDAMAGLSGFLAKLEKGEGTLGRLMTEPQLYDDLAAAAADFRQFSAKIQRGEGSLGRLMQEDDLYNQTLTTMTELRKMAVSINQGQGTLGRLVNDEELYLETSQAMARLNSIATKIDEGQGTLGKLVNQDDLYRDAKTTLHKVERAVDGLNDTGPITALGVVVGTLF